ncbi:MAG: oxygen-independent coproporphyrinogen III oxidase [Pseudomonadales bacterium]
MHDSHFVWDADFLRRYDVRGPRYTSYPGAQTFSANYGVDEHEHCLQAKNSSSEPLSLYIHIPFCENICYYCACNKIVTRDHSKANKYLEFLYKEASMVAERVGKRRQITSLHFGGGTPTFLDRGQLTELVYQLATEFSFSSEQGREFSIEIDPRTVERDTLSLLKGLGFNRISMGVQDFSPVVQRAVNRLQSKEHVAKLTSAARDFGFDSISYDLIVGLPEQTVESFSKTIESVVMLKPDRIALYNYAHLPRQFPSQRALDRLTIPGASEKLKMICVAANTLLSNGYRYIGMDHFVLESDRMAEAASSGRLQRSFQGYSIINAPETIGLGVSSISTFAKNYSQNHKQLEDYYKAIDGGLLPVARGLSLNQDDIIRRDLINRIISRLYVNTTSFSQQYSINFDQYFIAAKNGLHSAAQDGLIELEKDSIRVTERGRLLLRNICMLFDSYLDSTSTTFSRTL